MGIRNLTRFIKNNDFLKEEIIQDSKILVDGHCLMYFLAKKEELHSEYGGNYDVYRSNIDEFFNKLKDCNIEPIVILDGCKKTDDSKLETHIKRNETILNDCIRGQYRTVVPLLMRQEFRKSLESNNILYIMRHFEADDAIVELANYFDCHILSTDSDFFIHTIKKGVIAFDTLDIVDYKTTDKSKGKYMTGKVFYKDSLKRKFPRLTPHLIALGAMLHSNDFLTFPRHALEKLLKKNTDDVPAKISRQDMRLVRGLNSIRAFDYSRTYPNELFTKTFSWLNNTADYDIAFEAVKDVLPDEDDSFWEKMESNILKYVTIQLPSVTLRNHLSNYGHSTLLVSYQGKKIPGNFINS